MARAAGVPRYILPSSSSVYGQQEGLLSETAVIAPRTAYAGANAAAERDTLALAGPGFTACAVRQATVFGVSRRMRLAKTPYSAAKAAGDQIVRAYMQTYPEMNIRMTHCANNYGPFQLPEKLTALRCRASGGRAPARLLGGA